MQAAIAAGVTMTFKLLYNAAVAMTGGQDATGQLPVPQIATKLIAEGVKQVIITTDDPGPLPRRKAARTAPRCGTATASSRPRSTSARCPA